MINDRVSDGRMHDDLPGRGIATLNLGERFALWLLRVFIARERGNPCAPAALARGLAQARAPEAGAALSITVKMIAAGANRIVEVRCPPCETLSEDEDRFLALIAAAQAGAQADVVMHLSAFVKPGALGFTAIALNELAGALASARYKLAAIVPDEAEDEMIPHDEREVRRYH